MGESWQHLISLIDLYEKIHCHDYRSEAQKRYLRNKLFWNFEVHRERQQNLNSHGVFLSIIISVTGKISQVFISHPALCNKILHYQQHQTIFSCLTYTCTDTVWLLIINIFQSVPAPPGTHLTCRHHQSSPHLSAVNNEIEAEMQAQRADGFGSIRVAKQTKPHMNK